MSAPTTECYLVSEYGYYAKECSIPARSKEEAIAKSEHCEEWELVFESLDFTQADIFDHDFDCAEKAGA